MTAKELYDHITSKMTPEEALMRLLGGQIEVYKKLKENMPIDDGETQVNPMYIIAAATMDMGWNFVVEGDRENVEGLIVGTEEYIERNLKTV